MNHSYPKALYVFGVYQQYMQSTLMWLQNSELVPLLYFLGLTLNFRDCLAWMTYHERAFIRSVRAEEMSDINFILQQS